MIAHNRIITIFTNKIPNFYELCDLSKVCLSVSSVLSWSFEKKKEIMERSQKLDIGNSNINYLFNK